MDAHAGTAGRWSERAIELIRHVQQTQAGAIATAARWSCEAIAAGGLVHMYGSGHSRIAVEEMFPRYGSFPGFHPIVELSTTFHTQVVGANGQRQAMYIERTSGLAEVILSNFAFGEQDVMVVFSVSGTSAVAVEMAQGARRRGLRTIAVTSGAAAPADPDADHLAHFADLVIDIGTPPGDALVSVPGLDEPVGPGSTAATVAVVNELKVQTAELLVERGIRPPVLTAASVIGAERSAELFDAAYDQHAQRLARAIGGAGAARRSAAAENRSGEVGLDPGAAAAVDEPGWYPAAPSNLDRNR
ncbi:sugar isomerase domain-containing protein [Pseudactinotalea sp. Z1739]|uniref:sugar isomerase domain-containing protein n=1 Tax=Pseudactinotalea sp. Z1739 TaxID=3413028 RepID=UPI003C798D2E